MTTAERFWAKVEPEPTSGCWLWVGSRDGSGYGNFNGVGAHRWAYETERGPIQPGLEIDHRCRVRSCVNPTHMEPVTHADNLRRFMPHRRKFRNNNARKETCPRGHRYDILETSGRPFPARRCSICRAGRHRKREPEIRVET